MSKFHWGPTLKSKDFRRWFIQVESCLSVTLTLGAAGRGIRLCPASCGRSESPFLLSHFHHYWNLPAWNPPVTVLVSHYRSSNQSCSSEVLGHECPHFFPRRICKVAGQLWYMAIRLWWGSVARWSFDRRGHWGVRYATSSKYTRLFFLVWWSVEYWFFFYLSKNKIKKSCLSPTTPQNPGGVIRVNLTSWESKLMWWVQQGPCCHFWIVLYRV